jgi:hypothetical protein
MKGGQDTDCCWAMFDYRHELLDKGEEEDEYR